MAMSILYLRENFPSGAHHGKVLIFGHLGPGPGPKWAWAQFGPRPQLSQHGQNSKGRATVEFVNFLTKSQQVNLAHAHIYYRFIASRLSMRPMATLAGLLMPPWLCLAPCSIASVKGSYVRAHVITFSRTLFLFCLFVISLSLSPSLSLGNLCLFTR